MSTISLRVNDEESRLIRQYAQINGLNLSDFIRTTVLDRIEDSMQLSADMTKRILEAREQAHSGKTYTHEEFWNEAGVE